MAKQETYTYEPDFVTPPGDTLLELLEERSILRSELARRMGRPIKTINEIIRGKTIIMPETALQLERVLRSPALISPHFPSFPPHFPKASLFTPLLSTRWRKPLVQTLHKARENAVPQTARFAS